MTKEPELPELVRDLEIVQSLDRMKHPTGEYVVEAEPVNQPDTSSDGATL